MRRCNFSIPALLGGISIAALAASPAAIPESLAAASFVTPFGYRSVMSMYAAAMAISDTVHVYTMSPKSISPTTDVPTSMVQSGSVPPPPTD